MKIAICTKSIIIITLCSIASIAYSQDDKGLARVTKSLGIEVYVMCEPVRSYDVVEKLTTSFTTIMANRQNIQKQTQEVISRALKKKEKGKMKDFDAVITADGDVMILVKFKD
jgi:hypothetical protein